MDSVLVFKLIEELAYGQSIRERRRYYKIGGAISDDTINQSNYYVVIGQWCKNITSDSAIKSWQRIADHIYTAVYEQKRVVAYNVVYG